MDSFENHKDDAMNVFLTPKASYQSFSHHSRRTSWGTPIPPPSQTRSQGPEAFAESMDEISLSTASGGSDKGEPWNTVENITALGLSFGADDMNDALPTIPRFSIEESEAETSKPTSWEQNLPFDKWLKTLHRRAVQRRQTVSGDFPSLGSIKEPTSATDTGQLAPKHKKSYSGSSFGFVTAVKSASISLASISLAPRSRRTAVSSRHIRTDRSNKASNSGTRYSEDSSFLSRSAAMDEAVAIRAMQRRRVIEEIISTEESYVADIKFLKNVYVTLLASIPTFSLNLRSSISRNLTEIVQLHEELLGDLHRVVPHSEYSQPEHTRIRVAPLKPGHQRWRSLDAVPEHKGDLSWLQKIPGLTSDSAIAAEVAKVFGKKMYRFFAYEEYGAKYEMMVKDVASTYRTIPQWEVYQKGLEALAASLASINAQNDNTKKSLTVGDLLVKPIQRVCRYPLLFAELLKQTPVCDCPDSHLEIEKVLTRLRETTGEINKATDDPRMKASLEKTWLLQDRLVFPDQLDTRSKNVIQALGHVHLCGVLHGVWQTRDGIEGNYMISILYRDCLVLATAGKSDQIYTIKASIGLGDIRVEEVDNGRGLQCHTVPFSWKLVFECDHQLFEMILSACTPKEELEWRSRLSERASRDGADGYEILLFRPLVLGMKPMGTVFGKPGTIARRLSIHRATTVGPKSSLCQVIIKNTSAIKDITYSASCTSINRSQSLLTTNRIPTVAPSRVERVRLENLLSDVWSRDILPFPGMTGRARSEHLVRASASSMMRKLSVASITSNFTKRSGSLASLASFHRAIEDEHETPASYHTTRRPSHNETSCECIVPGCAEDHDNAEDTTKSQFRLPVIQDENLTFDFNFDENPAATNLFVPSAASDARSWASSPPGPVGKLKTLATLRVAKSWAGDRAGAKNITPPLRTSSANSMGRLGKDGTVDGSPLSSIVLDKRYPAGLVGVKDNVESRGLDTKCEVAKDQEKENGKEREGHVHRGIKWTKHKGRGLHRVDLSGGLRSFFR